MQSKLFTNFSGQDFTHKWDGSAYTFKAGQSVYLEDFKADHFAKHLVDRELQKKGKLVNDHSRSALMNNCFIGNTEAAPDKTAEEVASEVVNLNLSSMAEKNVDKKEKPPFCDSCDSKGVFHKRECPKKAKKEDEFEELSQ